MTWLDDLVRSAVDSAMDILTTTAVLVRQDEESSFNPFDESDWPPTESSTTFKATPALAYHTNEIDDELILRGDMKILLSPRNQTVVPSPATDHLIQSGNRYRVISVDIVSGGNLAGLYKIQLRRI